MASKRSKPSNSLGPQSLLSQIGSKHSLDWWVLALAAIPAIESQIGFDAYRLGGAFYKWAVTGLAGMAVLTAVFLLARKIVLPNLKTSRPFLVLSIYASAGLLRGIAIHEIAEAFALEDHSQRLYRYLIAPVFTTVLLSTFAIVVSSLRGYRDSLVSLSRDRARLRMASINLKSSLEKTRTELQTRILGVLEPAIAELERRLEAINDATSLRSALEALKNTVEDVVRPLSHDVAEANFEQLVMQTTETVSQDTRQQRFKLPVTLHPIWAASICGVIGLGPALVSRSASNSAMASLALALVMWLLLGSVNLVTRGKTFRLGASGFIYVASFTLGAGVFILASGLVNAYPSLAEQTQIIALVTLLGVVMFLFDWAEIYRTRNLSSARNVNSQFELLNSRLRRQVLLEHRRMAGVLHGQLQGALYAAAIRLNQSGQPNHFLIENLKSEIQQALAELTHKSTPGERFDVVLGQMISMWEDAVKFETVFEFGAMKALNKNRDAAECAIEVIREGINNAIKHGKATKITIELAMTDVFIEVKLINDGATLPDDTKPGYGSEVLSEYTHKWWRRTSDNGVELGAQVLI